MSVLTNDDKSTRGGGWYGKRRMTQYTHYSTEGGEEILYREVEKAPFPRRSGDHDTYAFGTVES